MGLEYNKRCDIKYFAHLAHGLGTSQRNIARAFLIALTLVIFGIGFLATSFQSFAADESVQCNTTLETQSDSTTGNLIEIPNLNGETFQLGGAGDPSLVIATIRDAIATKGFNIKLPYRGALLRSVGKRHHLETLQMVCRILGFRNYVSSTCLDAERSEKHPNGKCNFDPPKDEVLWRIVNDDFRREKAVPKNRKTWIASITCQHKLPVCADGWDNDEDGLIDMKDSGCVSANDDSELPHQPTCPSPEHTPIPTNTPNIYTALDSRKSWIGEGDKRSALFGFSISTAGDVNYDGYTDVIVGAPQYSNGEAFEGQAYLYFGSAQGLSAKSTLIGEGEQSGAAYGYSVSDAGDVNNDGYGDVIVSSPVHSNGEAGEGRVYLYLGSSSGLQTPYAWMVEGNQDHAMFGVSVAGAGDVNNDGFDDIVVGARGYSNGESKEGRAYLYLGTAQGLSSKPTWIGEGNQYSAYYGISVSGAGDVNKDGYDDVIVGAFGHTNSVGAEGRAYLYLGTRSGLSNAPAWIGEGKQRNAYYGISVTGAGDVNNDGHSDVMVGAYQYDNGEMNEGKAYLYLGSTSGLSITPAWTGEGNQAFAQYGYNLASAGDINNDGYGDVVVGAYKFSNGQALEGRAYLYMGSSTGLSRLPAWTGDGAQGEALYGGSVSNAGDVNNDGYGDIAVGARYFTNGESDEGQAYIYLGGATYTPTPTQTPTATQTPTDTFTDKTEENSEPAKMDPTDRDSVKPAPLAPPVSTEISVQDPAGAPPTIPDNTPTNTPLAQQTIVLMVPAVEERASPQDKPTDTLVPTSNPEQDAELTPTSGCNNGVDDPGCSIRDYDRGQDSNSDCFDGEDNDGDGVVDANDPGCQIPNVVTCLSLECPTPPPIVSFEKNGTTQCNDGVDNDGDGKIDFVASDVLGKHIIADEIGDPGCASPQDYFEDDAIPTRKCADNKDNDGDGAIDLMDLGCSSFDDDDEGDDQISECLNNNPLECKVVQKNPSESDDSSSTPTLSPTQDADAVNTPDLHGTPQVEVPQTIVPSPSTVRVTPLEGNIIAGEVVLDGTGIPNIRVIVSELAQVTLTNDNGMFAIQVPNERKERFTVRIRSHNLPDGGYNILTHAGSFISIRPQQFQTQDFYDCSEKNRKKTLYHMGRLVSQLSNAANRDQRILAQVSKKRESNRMLRLLKFSTSTLLDVISTLPEVMLTCPDTQKRCSEINLRPALHQLRGSLRQLRSASLSLNRLLRGNNRTRSDMYAERNRIIERKVTRMGTLITKLGRTVHVCN